MLFSSLCCCIQLLNSNIIERFRRSADKAYCQTYYQILMAFVPKNAIIYADFLQSYSYTSALYSSLRLIFFNVHWAYFVESIVKIKQISSKQTSKSFANKRHFSIASVLCEIATHRFFSPHLQSLCSSIGATVIKSASEVRFFLLFCVCLGSVCCLLGVCVHRRLLLKHP